MPWYSRSILKKDAAENRVMEFTPSKFDLGTPLQALEYIEEKKNGSDFLMSPVTQMQTGVDELQRQNIAIKAEELALAKLQTVQETAYKEGYDLGLDEGSKQAYAEKKKDLDDKMNELGSMFEKIRQLKKDLELQNEAHLVRLVFHMASRISLRQIEMDNNIIIDVMRQALNLAQDEENVVVKVSEQQFDFIEEVKKQSSREFEFLKKVVIEPSPSIKAGGCIVETNYGEVDARIEQRLEKLWENLSEAIPKVKGTLNYESVDE
jgi:flagellar assembly protein FliH